MPHEIDKTIAALADLPLKPQLEVVGNLAFLIDQAAALPFTSDRAGVDLPVARLLSTLKVFAIEEQLEPRLGFVCRQPIRFSGLKPGSSQQKQRCPQQCVSCETHRYLREGVD